MYNEVQEEMNRLRARADFLAMHKRTLERMTYTNMQEVLARLTGERYPGVKSWISINTVYGIQIEFHGPEARQWMRVVRREIGGLFSKRVSNYSMMLERRMEEPLGHVRLILSRASVCERVEQKISISPIAACCNRFWTIQRLAHRPLTLEKVKVEWKCEPALR